MTEVWFDTILAEDPCVYVHYTWDLGSWNTSDAKNITECRALSPTPDTTFLLNILKVIKKNRPDLLSKLKFYKWENNCEESSAGLPRTFFILETPLENSNETEFQTTLEIYFKLGTVLRRSVVLETTDFVNSFDAFAETQNINQTVAKSVNFWQSKGRAFHRDFYFLILNKKYAKALYDRTQFIIATGIYHIWDKWIRIFNPTVEDKTIVTHFKIQAKHTVSVRALHLQGNFVSGFFIYGGCLIVVALAFVIEYHESILVTLERRWTNYRNFHT